MTECRMDRVRILLTVAALLGLGAGAAETLHVRVVGVHDDDTLTALTDVKQHNSAHRRRNSQDWRFS